MWGLGLTLTRVIAVVLRFNHASVAWKSSGVHRRGAFANCPRTAATSSAIHRCCADPAGGAAPAQPHRHVARSRPLHGGVPRVGRHTCDTRTGSLHQACIPPTAAVAPRHSESAALSELAPPRNCRSWRRSIRRSSVAWFACPCISEPTRAASTAQPPLARTVDQRNLVLWCVALPTGAIAARAAGRQSRARPYSGPKVISANSSNRIWAAS